MSTLYVLLPPLQHAGTTAAFAAWLAHGDALPELEPARDATLRALFHFAGAALPVGALRHRALTDDERTGAWLAADPAYVRSEATGARLMTWPVDDLAHADAMQLAAALRPLFGDSGTPLEVDAPAAWCVHLPSGNPPTTFVPPADALGVDMLACLPHGDGARVWRRLFTEAQVILHAHPVNAARVVAGKLPVNALWLWGAGALPEAIDTTLAAVASGDAVVRGLAKVAGVACIDAPRAGAAAAEVLGTAGDALLDLDVRGQSDAIDGWLPPFQAWLRRRRFDAIELTFADGAHRRVRHFHRLRFWRHA